MRRAVSLLLTLAVLSLASLTPASARVAAAQDAPDPPDLGDTVFEDPLTATGVLRASTCPTRRIAGDFVPTGFRINVTGRCRDTDTNAGARSTMRDLTIGDGDVSIDVTPVEGVERARIILYARQQENQDGYALIWEPGLGLVQLRRWTSSTGVLLAERGDLARPSSETPTRLALRVDGERLWGFLDDELVVFATDGMYTGGFVAIASGRTGNPDDDEPSTVVWQNLRVAALVDGDAPRAPTYAPPEASPAS